MIDAVYLPLFIMPAAGLVILVVVWIIIAKDRRHGSHRHGPAE